MSELKSALVWLARVTGKAAALPIDGRECEILVRTRAIHAFEQCTGALADRDIGVAVRFGLQTIALGMIALACALAAAIERAPEQSELAGGSAARQSSGPARASEPAGEPVAPAKRRKRGKPAKARLLDSDPPTANDNDPSYGLEFLK